MRSPPPRASAAVQVGHGTYCYKVVGQAGRKFWGQQREGKGRRGWAPCLREGDVRTMPRSSLQPGREVSSRRTGCSCPAGRALLRFPSTAIEKSRFLISFSPSLSPPLCIGVLQGLIEIVKRPVTALAFLPSDQSRPRAGRARQQCASWPSQGGRCGTGAPRGGERQSPPARALVSGKT